MDVHANFLPNLQRQVWSKATKAFWNIPVDFRDFAHRCYIHAIDITPLLLNIKKQLNISFIYSILKLILSQIKPIYSKKG